jgi:TetR/AcrR family acrAB operon transcriptional repressor
VRSDKLVAETRSEAAKKAPRRVRRGPFTRKQILDASLKLFSEKGFARTSVRDIAQAAGITDAAIYYHFDSKRDLFEALFEERGITSALAGLEQAAITEPLLDTLQAIATSALEIMQRNKDFMKVLLSEAVNEDPIATEDYRFVTERWRKAQARILREFIDRGELPKAVDVDQASRQLVTLVVGPFTDALMSGEDHAGPDPAPELVGRVCSAIEHFTRGLQT